MRIAITKSICTQALALAILFSNAPLCSQQETRTTHQDQKSIAITIYNDGLALVKDQREVNLKKGTQLLAFMDVSAKIQPETALLHNLSHPQGFSVIEQMYAFDSLTARTLLQKHVGRKVGVLYRHPGNGERTIEQATLLTANEGVILRFRDGRIETGIAADRLVYQEIPQNLRERPTLLLQCHSPITGSQKLELSYLTTGLSWKADYVAELNHAEDRFDLKGWATLTNQSGSPYQDAHLQLVAGEVHRIISPLESTRMQVRVANMSAEPSPMEEETLLDYPLYTLEQNTTIEDNQTKQVALLSANNIAVQKQYELRSHTPNFHQDPTRSRIAGLKQPVTVYLYFNNTEKTGLGVPLPAGILRAYKLDAAGNIQFVGEDRIPHLSENAMAKVRLGQTADVTAEKRWMEYHKLDSNAFEATFEILLRNAKKESVTVKVAEFIPGDWHIFSENFPHRRETANAATWQLLVPAEEQRALTVSFRTRI